MAPRDTDNARLHLTIAGRVQGVFFRGSSVREAQKLVITGYARNRPDGTVEIVAEGSVPALREFAAWRVRDHHMLASMKSGRNGVKRAANSSVSAPFEGRIASRGYHLLVA